MPTLFDSLPVRVDTSFSDCVRIALDGTSWVDHLPGWLEGSDEVFTGLSQDLPWCQRRGVPMYDGLVDEPRLTSRWSVADEPEPLPVLGEMRALLSDRYRVAFDSIGFNLYRDGSDSVAWHGDRHRHHVSDPVVAIVSVGEARPLRFRKRAGPPPSTPSRTRVPSRSWDLGHGDLLVMGGACQHEWEHSVPKSRNTTGPRLSITFRHGAG